MAPLIPKRVHACDLCRSKKIRCVGDNPCSNCAEHGASCIFTPHQRRRKRPRDPSPSSALHRRARSKDVLNAGATSVNHGRQMTGQGHLAARASHPQRRGFVHPLPVSQPRRLSEVSHDLRLARRATSEYIDDRRNLRWTACHRLLPWLRSSLAPTRHRGSVLRLRVNQPPSMVVKKRGVITGSWRTLNTGVPKQACPYAHWQA